MIFGLSQQRQFALKRVTKTLVFVTTPSKYPPVFLCRLVQKLGKTIKVKKREDFTSFDTTKW